MGDIPNIFALGQDAFDQSYQRANKMRQDRARVGAGRAIAGGDYQAGSDVLNQAGMLDQAHNVLADQQVMQDRATAAGDIHAEREQKAQAARLASLLEVAKRLKRVPYGQRAIKLAEAAPGFQSVGMDPSMFIGKPEEDLSDANLDFFAGQAAKKLHFITQGPNTLAVDDATGDVEQTYKGPLIVKKDETIYAPDEPGAPPPVAAAPQASATPQAADAVWSSIKRQESGGEKSPGTAVGPDTQYGHALGSTQMLQKTAHAMAAKLGVPFRPDLLQSNTPEALAYQDKLGRAYFDEGVQNSGGDLAGGAAYYYGGPDPKMHGPKTKAYVQAVMARAGNPAGVGADTLQGGAGKDSAPPAGYHLMAQGAPGGAPTSVGNTNLTGEAYLATIPPGLARQVRLISQGKLAAPNPNSRSPNAQVIAQAVASYDPTFDGTDFQARQRVQNDFTSGKSAFNAKALNTAIGHLGRLATQIDGTSGMSGFPGATTVNRAVNSVERSAGDPRITNFEQTASALATELTAVFRGAGGAEADVSRYLGQLNSNASTEQKRGAVKNIVDLLSARLDALDTQYKNGLGVAAAPDGVPLVTPAARRVLQQIESGALTGGRPVQPSAPSSGGWGKAVVVSH